MGKVNARTLRLVECPLYYNAFLFCWRVLLIGDWLVRTRSHRESRGRERLSDGSLDRHSDM